MLGPTNTALRHAFRSYPQRLIHGHCQDDTRMQQTAWRVIRGLPRRCRGDHTGLRGLSQSGFCWHGPQLIRMLSRLCGGTRKACCQ